MYLVNNPACATIVFNAGTADEKTVAVDSVPFIYKYEYTSPDNTESEEIISAQFLDKNGNIVM